MIVVVIFYVRKAFTANSMFFHRINIINTFIKKIKLEYIKINKLYENINNLIEFINKNDIKLRKHRKLDQRVLQEHRDFIFQFSKIYFINIIIQKHYLICY